MEPLAVEEARDACRQKRGDLAVITGEGERKFLWRQITRGTLIQYYIGMRVNLDKSFSWLDGSPVTYTAWEQNEPNFANNDENCVSMYKSMGYWNDINCGAELPSICKRRGDQGNDTASTATTPAPRGGCPPDFTSFQGKCYKVMTGSDKMNWQDARTHCINQGGNLASVLNTREQAFLTMQLQRYPQDLWIGLNDVNWEMTFLWTDGRGVVFTNWARGHPSNSPDGRYSSEEFDCVVIVGSVPKLAGLWKVEDCGTKRGFVCKRNVDSNIAVKPTTLVPSKAFAKFGNDSYKVQTTKMGWDEARRQCIADDAELASILNPMTHAFVSLQVDRNNASVWIGLNNNLTGGKFRWLDNWPLTFTKWAPREPKTKQACVYMDTDKTWKTAPCTNNYHSLCKQSPDIPPMEPPQLPGNCPESKSLLRSWVPFRGHCYSFHSYELQSWAHASVKCLRTGGTLASIEDPEEARFIQQNLEILKDESQSFWIGMYLNHKGETMWMDNSVVDYTNWKPGGEKSQFTCVEVHSDSGLWSLNRCNRYRPFICKIPKTATRTQEASSGSAGVIVAVVLVSIAAVGLGLFLLRHRIPRPSLTGERTFDNHLYFNNPIRSGVDTKGLVANIEHNEQS
ncbi:hypothetical protein NHX12_021277 [Muraenolepis orangiensis]|uniref:C-type lectin domain-containing protein n=1 Tax=Muraenolepis orangiensis TaxID=630683 RepID=A0A9Q0IVZ4_9TELE|nr:hypothetical protein NHX12_021277 [Muraenolepis orangiensis]